MKKTTNRERIDALKEIYKLKAEYYKDEILNDVTGGFTNTSSIKKIFAISDIISFIGKISRKH